MVFEFSDADGIYFVAPEQIQGQEVGLHEDVARVRAALGKSFESVRLFVARVGDELGSLGSVQEVEIEFGLKYEPNAKVLGIELSGGSADLKVKVKIVPKAGAETKV